MKFLKQLSLYTLVGIISAGINFFVMPYLSHYLTPADYGKLSLINTYVTILIPLLSLCSNSILSVDYFKQKQRSIFAQQFSSVQLVPIVVTSVSALLTLLFYSSAQEALELRGESIVWGFIILVLSFFTIFCDQFLNFLVFQKKASLYAGFVISRVALEVLLTVYFVTYLDLGWKGRIYSWMIISTLLFGASFFYFKAQKFFTGRISLNYIKASLIFGFPLIFHSLGKFVVNQSDRLFIIKMISIDEAGIYNIGYTVGSLIMIVVNAFFSFYTPFLMERLSDLTDSKKVEIVRMSYVYFAGIIGVLLVMSLLAPFFFRYFIDPSFIEGVKYVFWIGLGYVFWGGYMLFALFINYHNKNRVLAWLALFNVVTNIVFNYYFISWFGAIGAAYATALSFFLLFALVGRIVNQLSPLPWLKFKKILQRNG